MADGTGAAPPPDHGSRAHGGAAERRAEAPVSANLADMATDWITIWQSELASLAMDREARENWLRLVDLWAQTAQSAARLLPRPLSGDAGTAGRAGTAAAAGTASAMAAPDARDAAIRRLADRVDELERQLGALGGTSGGPAGG